MQGPCSNIGNVINSFTLRHHVNRTMATETWLSSRVEPTFSKIPSYTHWVKKDCHGRKGGVAVCIKDYMEAQTLALLTFIRAVLTDSNTCQCTVQCPLIKGPASLDFHTEHLNDLLMHLCCSMS